MDKKERYHQILKAIEAERAHDEAYYRSLTQSKTIKERVEAGIAWYPVQINKKHYTVGDLVEIEVERVHPSKAGHKFKAGMGCSLFKHDEEEDLHFSGVVSYVRRGRMGILFSGSVFDKDQIPENGKIGIELIYDERPYQIMKAAINQALTTSSARHAHIRDGIAMQDSFADCRPLPSPLSLPRSLNASQVQAIHTVMSAEHIGIIHGPPGTGKTTTLCAMIEALTQTEKRILVCAPSNNAVDLLAHKLHSAGIRVLRIGNVSRIGDHIAHLSIDEQMSQHKEWSHIKKVRIEAEQARRQAGTFKRKFGREEAKNRGLMYKEARQLRRWARDLEDRLAQEILDQSQVIATTLIGASSSMIEGLHFDTVVIDEASQAREPECWNALLKAERMILAGDHLQLSPTVKSDQAQKLGLGTTLLDLLVPHARHVALLEEQYRMNDSILHFPNVKWYDGKLRSNSSIAQRKLDDDQAALVWIDTSGCGYDEQWHSENNSRWNEGEFFILREHLLRYQTAYTAPLSIGIISPYAQQVRYIKEQLEVEADLHAMDIEVNSIDGFQGQEKDIILLSLVRSNENGEIGFLADQRRLNVALTRARQKVVLIGDIATLCTNSTFNNLIEHIEQHGVYQSAWEYMA